MNEVSVLMKLVNKFSPNASKIASSAKKLEEQIGKLNTKYTGFDKQLRITGLRMQNFGKMTAKIGAITTAALTVPIVLGLKKATNAATEYEYAWAGVLKMYRTASKTQLAKIKMDLIDISKYTGQTITESFKFGEITGQLGIPIENLSKFVKNMSVLVKVTNLQIEEGTRDIAKFANIVDMDLNLIDKLASTINYLGANSAASETEIVNMMMRIADTGKIVNMTIPNIVALSAAFVSLGLEPEAVGTSFRKVMITMMRSFKEGGESAVLFSKIAGIKLSNMQKLFETAPEKAFAQFVGGLNKLKEKGFDVMKILEALGIKDQRQLRLMLDILSKGKNLINRLTGVAASAWESGDTHFKEFETKLNTFKIKFDKFKVRLKLFAIKVGEILLPFLSKLMDTLIPLFDNFLEWFDKLSPKTKELVVILTSLIAIVGPLVMVIGFLISTFGSLIASFGEIAILATLLVSLGYLIYDRWNDIQKAWEFIKTDLESIWFELGETFEKLWNKLKIKFKNAIFDMANIAKILTNPIGEGSKILWNKLFEEKNEIPKIPTQQKEPIYYKIDVGVKAEKGTSAKILNTPSLNKGSNSISSFDGLIYGP